MDKRLDESREHLERPRIRLPDLDAAHRPLTPVTPLA
jgi:hypothetical protein